MTQKFNHWYRGWFVLGLLVIVYPYIALSFYTHAFADDYFFVYLTNNKTWGEHLYYLYFKESGRLFSWIIIRSCNPLVYGWQGGFKFIPLLWILGLFASLVFFLKSLLDRSISFWEASFYALFFLAIYLSCAEGLQETVYWASGGMVFILPIILFFLHQGLVLRLKSFKYPILGYAGLVFLAFAIMTSVEYIALLQMTLSILIWLNVSLDLKKVKHQHTWILLINFLFFLVMLLAPGNWLRLQVVASLQSDPDLWVNMPFGKKFILGTYLLFTRIFAWMNYAVFWLGAILLLPLMHKVSELYDFKRYYLCHPVFFFISGISFLIFTQYFALETKITGGRILHAQFFIFFVFFFSFFQLVFSSFLHRKIRIQVSPNPWVTFTGKLLFISILLFASSANTNQAYYDLVFVAPYYDALMHEREQIFEKAKAENKKTVIIKELPLYAKPTINYIGKELESENNKQFRGINPSSRHMFYFEIDTLIVTENPMKVPEE